MQYFVIFICFVLKYISLEYLGRLFEVLAYKVERERKNNNGLLPPDIFESVLQIAGHYLCFEIIIKTEGGVLLKKRGTDGERGWEGSFHIPGTAFRPQDDLTSILNRLSLEIFGKNMIKMEDLRFVGVEIHDERPERKALSPTIVWSLNLSKNDRFLSEGDWKLFATGEANDPQIIPFHQKTLKWAMDPNHSPIADLREPLDF